MQGTITISLIVSFSMTFSALLGAWYFARARKIEATKTIGIMIAQKTKKIMKKFRTLNPSQLHHAYCPLREMEPDN